MAPWSAVCACSPRSSLPVRRFSKHRTMHDNTRRSSPSHRHTVQVTTKRSTPDASFLTMGTPQKGSGLNVWGEPAPGQKTGVEIWRIENMKPVKQPTSDSGKFCSGDSYIVLNTYEVKNAKRQNVHFWLGKDSSQDERGAAVRRKPSGGGWPACMKGERAQASGR